MKVQKKELLEVLESIKKKCRDDCCAGDKQSWLECTIKDCTLHRYRLGYNPKKLDNSTQENKLNPENKGVVVEG